jgi:hypothetical protein
LTVTVTTTGTAATLTYVSNATGWAITDCNTNASGVLNIPSSISGFDVTEIRPNAFNDCTSLTSIRIPNSVTVISDATYYSQGAFSGCTSLTSVTIPSSVTAIGNFAFYGCTGLARVTIPSSVTAIGNFAFYGCTGLTSVTIPSSVTTIGNYAFSGCTGLTSVTIPSSVTTIVDGVFQGCTSLTSVTIPNSVTSIGSSVFQSCTSLTSVTIPSSVTTIGEGVFQSCTSLTSVTIPSSVTTIGYGVFQSCAALTDLVIPDRFIVALSRIGIPDALGSQILMEATAAYVAANNPASNEELIDALAADDAFLLALAQRVSAQNAQVYATKTELAGYATKAQITDATLGGLATGINTVTSHPNSWSLFTTAQIQEMAVGDLMLTRQENGVFVLNYDIEQSDDLNNWTTYKTNAEELTGLPTNKAFVRIKLKK